MAAYFHQDWEIDGGPDDVVDLFVHEEPHLATQLPAEIESARSAHPSEADLRCFLDHLGSYYVADWNGTGYHRWLARIAERARSCTKLP